MWSWVYRGAASGMISSTDPGVGETHLGEAWSSQESGTLRLCLFRNTYDCCDHHSFSSASIMTSLDHRYQRYVLLLPSSAGIMFTRNATERLVLHLVQCNDVGDGLSRLVAAGCVLPFVGSRLLGTGDTLLGLHGIGTNHPESRSAGKSHWYQLQPMAAEDLPPEEGTMHCKSTHSNSCDCRSSCHWGRLGALFVLSCSHRPSGTTHVACSVPHAFLLPQPAHRGVLS